MNEKITYKDAGVDTEKAANLIKKVKSNISKTHIKGTMSHIGGFAGLFDLKEAGFNDPILVSGTDGVGTKLKLAIDANKHEKIGFDLVAMCVNDILVQGAKPLFFLDYFACGKLDLKISETVINSISEACLEAEASLLGGETAEMPDMYKTGEYDLAGFVVGACERKKMLPKNSIDEDHLLIGIASSGIHSNGYSLIRKIIHQHKIDIHAQCEFEKDKKLIDILLTPTRIYVKELMPLIKEDLIAGMCHITGGGFYENMPRILPENYSYKLNYHNFPKQPIWQWIKSHANISDDEMLATFNCGIGMVLVINKNNLKKVEDILIEQKSEFYQIGSIIRL